ncbi:hypothetical protein C8Q75DRAFT_795843 [Abortiporus biennis]|nr:hypothetical protein C8Q75DRAFT_795843 [Abortiporus biennis]
MFTTRPALAGALVGLLATLTGANPIAPVESSVGSPLSPPFHGPPFDGFYLNCTAEDSCVEWKWFNIMAPLNEDNTPPAAIQVLMYTGYAFGPKQPGAPEFYVTIDGFYPNGTAFEVVLPASEFQVENAGNYVVGTWKDVGSYTTYANLSTTVVEIDTPQVSGSFRIDSRGQHHFGCNTTSTPYFNSAKPENPSNLENTFYNQLGWATTIPGGNAVADLKINGVDFQFSGPGYHDANWFPEFLNDAITEWFFGSASTEEYDFSYTLVHFINSTHVFDTGYLSRNGVVLQNQCNTDKTKTDITVLTPWGSGVSADGAAIPAGYILQYFLANGEEYQFNLTAFGQQPDLPVYHRFIGSATGGKVGEEPQVGGSVFEWLNPGLQIYTP